MSATPPGSPTSDEMQGREAEPEEAATSTTQPLRHYLGLAARIAFSIAVIVLLVRYARQQDWRQVLQTIHRANLPLLIGSTLLTVPLIWLKARRLHLLVAPSAHISTPHLMRIFCASYAADNIIMGQAGLGFRVAMLRRAGTSWTTAVALEALEKALEGMGMTLVVFIVMLHPALPPWVGATMRGCYIVALIAVGLTLALVMAGRIRMPWALRLSHAALALKQPRALVEVLLCTIAAWAVELLIVAGSLAALGLPWEWATSALVLLAVNLAALIPGLPANVGPFEASVVLALKAVKIAAPSALGFALVYHLLHTLPVTLIGLPDLRSRWRHTAAQPTGVPSSSANSSH